MRLTLSCEKWVLSWADMSAAAACTRRLTSSVTVSESPTCSWSLSDWPSDASNLHSAPPHTRLSSQASGTVQEATSMWTHVLLTYDTNTQAWGITQLYLPPAWSIHHWNESYLLRHSITALWPSPNYTASWRKHVLLWTTCQGSLRDSEMAGSDPCYSTLNYGSP